MANALAALSFTPCVWHAGALARPLPLCGPGEVRLRTSIARLDLERPAKVVDGAIEVALLGQGNAQVIVCNRIFGALDKGFAQVRDGFGIAVAAGQDESHAAVRQRVVPSNCERLREGTFGVVEPAREHQGVCHHPMALCGLRIQAQSFVDGPNHLLRLQPLFRLLHHAQMGTGDEVARVLDLYHSDLAGSRAKLTLQHRAHRLSGFVEELGDWDFVGIRRHLARIRGVF